jgi:ABC-type polysaccharide/polyol phosphate transport system ATPase subunit
MARIDLDNVSLTFRVRHHGRVTFKEYLVKRLFNKTINPLVEVPALRDVDLHLQDGDRLGVIGHNGAGKSTLLKLLAGIYPPTQGARRVQGRISSLFDLALGFETDASGWENIAYRGYLQGETPRTINAKMKEIAEFSELGKFLDMPVRFYSSGMLVRLAFSIASTIEPEILLVDEVLSVGDMGFQAKALQRMRDMVSKARLIVMVSHDLKSLPVVCDKAIWLDHGRIAMVGPVAEVIDAYTTFMTGAHPSTPAEAA